MRNPDITAKALRMISEGLPRALIAEWEEEVVEALYQRARDAECEEAEQAFNDAFAHLDKAEEVPF